MLMNALHYQLHVEVVVRIPMAHTDVSVLRDTISVKMDTVVTVIKDSVIHSLRMVNINGRWW